MENVIDTLEIARAKYPGSQNSLDALCRRFNIDNSRREKHTALIDCHLLKEVYINLLDQKEPKLDLENSENIEISQNHQGGGSTPIDIFKNFHPIDLKIFFWKTSTDL